jgi:predicted SPOUT superfamily RNA methylase MTH1
MKTAEQIIQYEQEQGYATESKMGSLFYQWAHNTYLADLHGLLFHVPNELAPAKGESRTAHMLRIQHAKAQGVVAGIEDYIYLGEPAKNRPAAAIELKTETGVLSQQQKAIHERHRQAGIKVYIVRNFTEWKTAIEAILGI